MVSVAFEVKLTLGGGSVIGESNAVVLGLLCGEKGGAHLLGQVLRDKLAVLGETDGVAERTRQSVVLRADGLACGKQVLGAGRGERQLILNAVESRMNEQGKDDIRIDAAVKRAELEAVRLAARSRGER